MNQVGLTIEELQRVFQKKELDEIINKPVLTPEEIWSISKENFFIWRKKHDYPRIINHFNEKLKGFSDWKKEHSLDDEFLINYGISKCIKPSYNKDNLKYLIESESQGEIKRNITFQNLDNKYYQLGNYKVNYKVLKSFIGYFDWCKSKKIEILPHREQNYNPLSIASGSSIFEHQGELSILDGLKLLNVGGIKVGTNVKKDFYGFINGKYFEFVNANYLSFEGTMFVRDIVAFDYSFIDNLKLLNSLYLRLDLFDSSLYNIEIKDSDIAGWKFTRCNTVGKIVNSDFKSCSVDGGNFQVDFKNTTLIESNARHSIQSKTPFEKTYRTFKQAYARQGNDSKAISYFLLEKKIERIRLRREILRPKIRRVPFNENKIKQFSRKIFHSISNLIRYVFLVINNFFWGYGHKPIRIVVNSLLIILGFAFIYLFSKNFINSLEGFNFIDSLYYSAATFLTFGISNFHPIGSLKIAVLIEALFGGLSLGFLVVGLSNSKF